MNDGHSLDGLSYGAPVRPNRRVRSSNLPLIDAGPIEHDPYVLPTRKLFLKHRPECCQIDNRQLPAKQDCHDETVARLDFDHRANVALPVSAALLKNRKPCSVVTITIRSIVYFDLCAR